MMVSKEEYRQRRLSLTKQLPEGAIVILSAATEILRNGDADYRFRQNSNFFYLTGSEEPESFLIIDGSKSILFNRPRNKEQEQWTGYRLGQEGACEILGMDEAWSLESFDQKLIELLADKTAIYFLLNQDTKTQTHVFQTLKVLGGMHRKGIKVPHALCDVEPLLSEMRLFKSDSELALMRKAAAISVEAHLWAMKTCASSKYEYSLEAELMYTFLRHGSRSPAYDPIVGCGANACILHYTANNKPLIKGELVLIDAGAEYNNYAADITRTFPVNGKFTAEQRALYELVWQAWKTGIATVAPGIPWNLIQKNIIQVLTSGLCDLGILKGKVEDCIENESYKPFYMHNSGHWLGLDVHDAGAYKKDGNWRELLPGMVLTVEPGLYISAHMEGVDEKWWNIGIRIEDDILVTKEGHENLTKDLPAQIVDIEACMRD